MSESSTGTLLTIRPTLPATTATGIFVGVGVVLAVILSVVGVLVAGLTHNGMIGFATAAALWGLAMWSFVQKTKRNMRDAQYEFHRDRLVFRMRDKLETLRYDRIGHVLFKGGQTIILSAGFDGIVPARGMRVDVPREDGESRFREVIDLIRRARPGQLFSYKNGRVEYTQTMTTVPGLQPSRISKMRTVAGHRPAYAEMDVVVDDSAEPAYTVLRPYDMKRKCFHHALAVIRKQPPPQRGPVTDAQVIMGFAGTDVSESCNSDWIHSDIVSGAGVHLGHFRIRRKLISPIDDFELELLGDTLKLRGNLTDSRYEITLNGAPVGRLRTRLWSLHTADDVEFTTPVDIRIALALGLAMNRRMLDDDADRDDDE
jgi:hypothetical protein